MLKTPFFGFLLILSTPVMAVNIDLGAATGFNLFIKEDFTQPGADAQGKVAIGGNANIGQYDVAVNYEPRSRRDGIKFWGDNDNYADVLVVGGNLTTASYAWGNIKGNVILGGELTAGSGKNSVMGTTTRANPIDFKTAFDYFSALSGDLANLGNTGGVEFKYNNWLILDGTSVADVYVANITGKMLADATDLTASGLTATDTLIINVSGKNINFDSLNYGQRERSAALALSANQILYNFFEAENITFGGGFRGNILAPKANFNFTHGDLSGQVIAKSWTGGWGAQANLWDGFFTPPPHEGPSNSPVVSVSEPSAIFLLFGGLIALICMRLMRRRQTHVENVVPNRQPRLIES